ncbi:Amino acid permease, conserved site [Acididesulfobacillus acetoxydans]|uniref:Amino acid permease, conserved site n=1 Tax=Acididesulfobacillus acetoxydans TaxID=1561005 RepID=A0A8S0W6M6_9FIRM|nr:amino acid permease [Acididesulfobacillus acetoxydans]CAA7599969.1 Amino acid permease, conserved site [Acididesulfobacillus acetoxydans]CEJ07939.1 Proline-specific permease ProY [Acididesulfobacillus acetoxydans]
MGQDVQEQEQLRRGLSDRHIQMIALGGAIGVGLFYGSATTIQLTGPAVMLSYLLGGIIIFIIMRALGEMAVAEPVSGSFSSYANRYLGRFAGFFTGWTYWFLWIVVGMAEISAFGIYIQYWFPSVPQWISALAALLIMTLVNLINVKSYGEFEFWFAMIKVVTILGLIVVGGLIIFFGLGNGGHALGLANMWIHGGFMPNGLKGFALAFVMVMFSFGGVELIGITAGEAKNPSKTIPKAVNSVIWRILVFYVGAIGVMMAIYPWNEIGSKGSPFVLVFAKVGIPAAASIINFVVITASLSAFNSGLFSTGRMLYNLALQGNGPKVFAKVSKSGTPANGIIFSAAALLIGVFLNYIIPASVFAYVSAVATVAMLTVWTIVLLTQLKFRKTKIAGGEKIEFKLPLWPFISYIALAFMVFIVVVMAFMPATRIALYVAPVWFLLLYVSYRMGKRDTLENVRPQEVGK